MLDGVIMSYNHHRNYGFIEVAARAGDPDQELFFHLSGARIFVGDPKGKYFWKLPSNRSRPSPYGPLPKIDVGKRVIFEVEVVDHKAEAVRWAFAPVAESPLVSNLRSDRYYRVVVWDDRLMKNEQGEMDETIELPTIWEGTDLLELSAWFPLPEDSNPDPLDFDGRFLGHRFQILRPSGWKFERKDPRIPLCCIPADKFREYSPPDAEQPYCPHRLAA